MINITAPMILFGYMVVMLVVVMTSRNDMEMLIGLLWPIALVVSPFYFLFYKSNLLKYIKAFADGVSNLFSIDSRTDLEKRMEEQFGDEDLSDVKLGAERTVKNKNEEKEEKEVSSEPMGHGYSIDFQDAVKRKYNDPI